MKKGLGVNSKELDDLFEKIWEKYENQICLNLDVDNLIKKFRKGVITTCGLQTSMLRQTKKYEHRSTYPKTRYEY